MCETTCKSMLVDVEVNCRALQGIRETVVSIHWTTIGAGVIARVKMSKSKDGYDV